jgi:hypothetical protein
VFKNNNDPRIAFAHKGGFIAKTKDQVTMGDLIDLVIAAKVD